MSGTGDQSAGQDKQIARLFLIFAGVFLGTIGAAVLGSEWLFNLSLSAISRLKGVPIASHWPDKLRMLTTNFTITGVVMLVFGLFVITRWDKVASIAKKKYVLVATLVILLIGLWLPALLFHHNTTINGKRYWWLNDDAMISMRYAHNLANGDGLVWNPGERVEGYTNFLWTIYMATVHLLPIPTSHTSLVVLLTNLLLAACTIPLIFWFVRTLGGGILAMIAAPVGFVFSRSMMYWTTSGFETALLTFLLLLASYRVLREAQSGQCRLLTYLLIALISLVRADAIVFSGLIYCVSFVLNKNRKLVAIYSVISLLLPVAHEVFRICYYGAMLPNTAYLKATNWDGKYVAGLLYILNFAMNHALLVVFALVGSLLSRKKEQYCFLGVFLLYMAYVAYVGGDVFPYFRFFVPVIPILMALAFVGIETMKVREASRLVIVILCLLTIPLVIRGYINPIRGEGSNVRIGLLLRENTPADSKVADFYAGSVFYFSERYAIDLLGKSDPYIAHLKTFPGAMLPGHNKFDFDYSLGVLKPDFLVAIHKSPADEDEMQQAKKGNYAFMGQLYFHPVFQQHYQPNPVIAETRRTIFVADWSDQVGNREKWTK